MQEQFIPYESALKLKELGFDENCLGYYRNPDVFKLFNLEKYKGVNQDLENTNFIKAPLWQQAFDFLVKKCELDSSDYSLEYTENGWLLCKFNEITQDFDVLLLNEEALKKLIELCKKQKN